MLFLKWTFLTTSRVRNVAFKNGTLLCKAGTELFLTSNQSSNIFNFSDLFFFRFIFWFIPFQSHRRNWFLPWVLLAQAWESSNSTSIETNSGQQSQIIMVSLGSPGRVCLWDAQNCYTGTIKDIAPHLSLHSKLFEDRDCSSFVNAQLPSVSTRQGLSAAML